MTVCLLFALTLFTGLSSSVAQNVTTLSGSTVTLYCRPPTHVGFFEWRFYSSESGQQIYSNRAMEQSEARAAGADHYRQVDDYGLEVAPVRWADGGVYGCRFIPGDELKFTVVVVERPVAEVIPAVMNVGDEVTLRCSVEFGAPRNTSRFMTAEKRPRLTMSLNSIELARPVHHYHEGYPANKAHRLTQETRLTVDRQHSGKTLSCTVSTDHPVFTLSTDRLLLVKVPAYDINVTPRQHQYSINDVIACSAQGFPTPEIQWTRRGTPGNPADDVTVRRSNLTVSEEMIGMSNSWTCSARNELNTEPLTVNITFTVTVTGETEDSSLDSPMSVSMLAVIAAAVAVLLIAIIVIIIVIVVVRRRKRRRGDGVEDEVTKHKLIPIPGETDHTRRDTSDHTPADNHSRPVPKPRTASTSSLDADHSIERPRPRARGSQESLDKSFDQPQPMRRPMARGSQESLDKSFDQPQPMRRPKARGSQDSLDESMDKPRRPRANPRGSVESLESVDSVGRPKPRARRSMDRELDEMKPPQVAVKPSKKPAAAAAGGGGRGFKDRTMSSDV